jgi:hypothetical protein
MPILLFLYLEIVPVSTEYDSIANVIKISIMVALNILSLIKLFNYKALTIYSVFMLNTILTLAIPTINPSVSISGIKEYYRADLFSSVLNHFLVFYLLTFLIWLIVLDSNPKNNLSEIIEGYGQNRKNKWVFLIALTASLVFVLFVPVGRQHVLRVINLPYEYSFVFVFLMYAFSRRSKISEIVIFVVLFSTMFKTLLFGGRVEALIALIIMFIIYFEKKISGIITVVISFFGIILTEVLSLIRSYFLTGNSELMYNKFALFLGLNNTDLIISTEGDVIYSSMVLTSLVDDGIVTFSDRIDSFVHFAVTQLIPVGRLFDDASLAYYIKDYAATGGGGMIFSQFYFWLGNYGVIIISLIVCFIVLYLYKLKKVTLKHKFISVIIVIAFAFFPRWTYYFPDYLFKFPILYMYVFLMFKIVDQFTKRQNSKIKALTSYENEYKR